MYLEFCLFHLSLASGSYGIGIFELNGLSLLSLDFWQNYQYRLDILFIRFIYINETEGEDNQKVIEKSIKIETWFSKKILWEYKNYV